MPTTDAYSRNQNRTCKQAGKYRQISCQAEMQWIMGRQIKKATPKLALLSQSVHHKAKKCSQTQRNAEAEAMQRLHQVLAQLGTASPFYGSAMSCMSCCAPAMSCLPFRSVFLQCSVSKLKLSLRAASVGNSRQRKIYLQVQLATSRLSIFAFFCLAIILFKIR